MKIDKEKAIDKIEQPIHDTNVQQTSNRRALP